MENVMGVDIGATQMRAGRVSNEKVSLMFSEKTPSDGDYDQVLKTLLQLMEKLFNYDTMAIGLGVPSVVDTKNGMIYDVINIPSWKEVPLKSILEKHFGLGKEYNHIAAVTLGSGVGTGLILNSKLYSGNNTGAGEFGMIPYLDKYIEYYCSGQFFNLYKQTDGLSVFEQAKIGDEKALKMYEEYGHHLGQYLKILLLAIDPEVIILGGSLSAAYSFFEKEMRKALLDFPYPKTISNLEIKVSNLPEIAILGAAALTLNEN
jgi:glucokinase